MLWNNSLYGNYRTRTFIDIFPTLADFKTEYNGCALKNPLFKEDSLTDLYYLLYAAYGNSHIASSDENQFKYKLYSIIYSKGLVWQKAVEIQNKLQTLSEQDIIKNTSYVHSHAYNPGEGGTAVDTTGQEIIQYINDQTSTVSSNPYIDSYFKYLQSLRDVSTDFIREFRKLFLVIVEPEYPLWYKTEEDDDDTNGNI